MSSIISLIVLIIAVSALIWVTTKTGSIKRNVLYTATIVQELRQQIIDINRQANQSIHKFNLLNKRLELMTKENVEYISNFDIDDINLIKPKINKFCENTIKLEDE